MERRIADQRALLIYIEPTPYIQDLVMEIASVWEPGIDVLYVDADVTQAWSRTLSHHENMLPLRRDKALWEISRRLGRYRLLHLAGWGHPILWGSLVAGGLRRMPMTVETDTPVLQPSSLARRAVKRCLYPWLFRLPSAFLPAGSRQAAYLRHYNVPSQRIRIAQMTVDVARMSTFRRKQSPESRSRTRVRYGLSEDAVVFLYVGRLEPYKGVPVLLSAFEHLRRTEPNAALLIVGDGSLRATVEAAAASGASAAYAGRLEGEALWEAYAAADVFVLASELESWGLVVNEAMAFNLPVIASANVGCVDDLVVEGETGLVVEARSAEALSMAMAKLMRDPDTRRRLASNAAHRISGWTLADEARNITETWAEVLSV